MTNQQKTEVNATTYEFQLLCIAISSLILGILIFQRINQYNSIDESPQLLPIIPEKAKIFGGTPAIVKVGLYMRNFSEFNTLTNNFTFNATLSFEFDPSIISMESVRRFYFDKGELLSISESATKLINDKLLVGYDIRLKKKDNLNYSFFPFSDHTFHFVITHRSTPSEVVYESSLKNFGLSKSVQEVAGWKASNKQVATGYTMDELEVDNETKRLYNPRVLFTIDYSLNTYRQLLTILLPLVLLFYLAIFSFSINPVTYYGSIMSLSSGAVTGLLAYRFVIENLSPKTGIFMLSDYIFFLILCLCCIIFLVNSKALDISRRAKYGITIFLHALFVGSMFYFLKFWVD